MLRPGKPKRARQGTVLPDTFDSPLNQDDCFEFDRANLILQLRTIQRAINESAEEMEMVAIERVFVNAVSKALDRTARKLYQVSEDLSSLHRVIKRAHFPKEPEPSNTKSRPHPRGKGRN
jgi:hypothetical protein